MKMKRVLGGLLALGAAAAAQADVLLSEGFENVPGLGASGWVQTNDSPSPAQPWFQGNPGVFNASAGPANSYAAANFNSTSAFSGPISNWLIGPTLNFFGLANLAFDLRLLGGFGYLDTVEVLYSSNGGSTNLADFASIGSFSSDVDTDWVPHTLTLGTAGANSGRFAFRYDVDDVATAGNYVGVDSVTATGLTVPEPTSIALVATALLGVGAIRRRA